MNLKTKFDEDDYINSGEYYILDAEKNVITASFYDHINFFRKCDNKIVKKEFIEDHMVSTVFCSTYQDLNRGEKDYKPLIFETIIESPYPVNFNYRILYHTYKEAEEGHKKAVLWLNKKLKEI